MRSEGGKRDEVCMRRFRELPGTRLPAQVASTCLSLSTAMSRCHQILRTAHIGTRRLHCREDASRISILVCRGPECIHRRKSGKFAVTRRDALINACSATPEDTFQLDGESQNAIFLSNRAVQVRHSLRFLRAESTSTSVRRLRFEGARMPSACLDALISCALAALEWFLLVKVRLFQYIDITDEIVARADLQRP